MSDPYTEATRNERTGMSTVAKVFLIGGGLVVAALAALFIWFSVSVDRMFSSMPTPPPPPPPVQESRSEAVQGAAELEESLRMLEAELEESFKRAAEQAEVEAALQEARQELVATRGRIEAAAANLQQPETPPPPAQESVAEELSLAVNTVLGSVFEDAGFSVEPVEGGVGLSFDIRGGTMSTRFDLVSDPEMLNRVSRGEGRLADLWQGDAAERAERSRTPLPEWVPVFPGADRKNSLSLEMGDLALGIEVLLADSPGHDIIRWYFRAADRMERAGTEFSFRQLSADGQPDPADELGRFSMRWEDRQVSVFVTEDDHGDSMFVLVYKGSTEGEEK